MWAPEWYPGSIERFDPRALAKSLQSAGVGVMYMWQGFTHDHFGVHYYPTSLGRQHRNLKGRDHVEETISAMHGANIKVVGYYSHPDLEAWNSNPDWRQRDAGGLEISRGPMTRNFGILCPNSPYRELAVSRIVELVERYPFDGFYLPDSLHFNADPLGCFCEYCRRKYRDQTGRNMPAYSGAYAPEWSEFISWRYRCIGEIFRELKEILKRLRPSLALTHIAFDLREVDAWRRGDHYEKTIENDDFVCTVAAWTTSRDGQGARRNPSLIWKTGMLAKHLKGIGGKPVHVHFGRFTYEREYQTTTVHELRVAAGSVLLHGGTPSVADNLFPDGQIEQIAQEQIAVVSRETRAYSDLVSDAVETPVAALYYSKQSHDFIDTANPGESRYLRAYEGAYKALAESHVPFKILGSRRLTPNALEGVRFVVLPEAIALSDYEIGVFDEFVRTGGGLICTGRTSLLNESGNSRGDFGLGQPLGIVFESTLNYRTSYLRLESNPISMGIDDREQVLIRDTVAKVSVRAGATVAANVVYPISEYSPPHRSCTFSSDMPPGRLSPFPAIVTNEYGNGRTVYFSGEVARTFGEFGYPNLLRLLANSFRWVSGGELPIDVEAPANVEVNWCRQGKRQFIHLLNYSIDGTNRIAYDKGGTFGLGPLPVGPIRIKLRRWVKKINAVRLASGSRGLKWELDGKSLTVSVDRLDIYDVVIID
jgi:hypothetical protein